MDVEELLRSLNRLSGKFQKDVGIVIWGQVQGAPAGTYAKILVDADGTLRFDGTTTISGTVDVSDRWNRQLGEVDIERYLGLAVGAANPLHSQIVVSGAVIDPRVTRALTSSDDVTAYGSQVQALLQRASTYDLIVQLRSAGVEIDPRSIRALAKATDELYSVLKTDAGIAYDARDRSWTLGTSDIITAYGSQTQALLQRATTYDLLVAIRQAGAELSTSNPLFSRPVDAAGNTPRFVKFGDSWAPLTDRSLVMMGVASGSVNVVQIDADGHLKTHLISASQVEINPATEDGNLALILAQLDSKTSTLFKSGQNIGNTGFNVNNFPSGFNVNNFPSTYDVLDRAARLLGVVYGSQGQQLKQTATNYNAQVELATGATLYDARQTRALTSSDIITAYGSQIQALLQRATTYDLIVQLRTAGAEYDARQIRTLTTSDQVAPIQTTRTNLTVKPEREDLISLVSTFSPNNNGALVVSGTPGQKIKVFDCAYEAVVAGVHYFYFGTGTGGGTVGFAPRVTVGPMAQTYPNPHVSAAGDSLYIYCINSDANMYVAVHYIKE